MQTPIPVLDDLFQEPEDGSGVTGAMVHLSPQDGETILRTMGFERQRDADQIHIGMLADMFLNHEFAAGSQITFAFDEHGNPRLVDGQHRLRAAIQAGWGGLWNVRVMFGDTYAAEGIYMLLDSYQKKRPAAVIGRALGLDVLSERMQSVAVAAASYQNQWSTDYVLPLGCKYPPVRDNINRVKERLPAFVDADNILRLGNVSSQAKRRLTTTMVMAVMVETLAGALKDQAVEFWTAVATHGDAIAGELRDGLIAGRPAKSRQFYNPRLAGQAWNQRASESKLRKDTTRIIKVEGTTMEIPV